MESQDKTLAETLSELEQLLLKMQTAEISLEESFSMYEQGVLLLRKCNEKIETVEKKMLVLNGQELI
jgi:exodeoxyribonuclease VII small subunit